MPSTLIDPIANLPAETTGGGVWVAAVLTLAVLSFILGDNPHSAPPNIFLWAWRRDTLPH